MLLSSCGGGNTNDVNVPNVVGMTQAAATTTITAAGLTVGMATMAASNTVPAGSVLSQSPAAGASVAPGSDVNLTVSSGATVPLVVGETQAAATTTITGAGLKVGTVTMVASDTVLAGTVISQSPVAGASVAPGSAVNLTVSLGLVANAWYPAGAMVNPRESHTATLLPNGMVLAAGGFGGPGYLASAETYNPVSRTWRSTDSMSTARAGHTATLLPNGTVLVAGGQNCNCAGGPVGSTEVYDPATGWSPTAGMSTPRVHHTATLLPNGRVLVAGGTIDFTLDTITATAELYDPATNTWSPAASMSTPRVGHTATLLTNGMVLVAGGSNNLSTTGITASAELYDPVSNAWSSAGSMSTARAAHSATALPSGAVLVAGGGTNGNSPVATADLYDPVGSTWSSAASMSTPREGHTATLLLNGMVLVTGGVFTVNNTGSITTATAELYNPTTNIWASAASMSTPRENHTATLLQNGPLLVAGGFNTAFASPTAELYYP